jgi:hypothetical protein
MTCRDSLTSIPAGRRGSITVSGVATRREDRRYTGTDPETERYEEWIRYLGAPGREVTQQRSVAPAASPAIPPPPPPRRRPLPPAMARGPVVPAARPGYPPRLLQAWHDIVYDDLVTRRTGGYPIVEPVRGRRQFLATFGWTVAWYAVPAALFATWSLTFPDDAGTACARPANGTCPSPRTAALETLLHGLPRVGAALVIALVVAGLIRAGSAAWRTVTTGFAAAIIGAGLATVLYSALHSTG